MLNGNAVNGNNAMNGNNNAMNGNNTIRMVIILANGNNIPNGSNVLHMNGGNAE